MIGRTRRAWTFAAGLVVLAGVAAGGLGSRWVWGWYQGFRAPASRVATAGSIVLLLPASQVGAAVKGFLVGYPPDGEHRRLYVVTAWHEVARASRWRVLRWSENADRRTMMVYPETWALAVDRVRDLAVFRLDDPLADADRTMGFRLGTGSLAPGVSYEVHALAEPRGVDLVHGGAIPQRATSCRLEDLAEQPLRDPLWPEFPGTRQVRSVTMNCRRDVPTEVSGSPLLHRDGARGDEEVLGVVVARESAESAEPRLRIVPADAVLDVVSQAQANLQAPDTASPAEASERVAHLLQTVWEHYLPDEPTAPISEVVDPDDASFFWSFGQRLQQPQSLEAVLDLATRVDRGGVLEDSLATAARAPRQASFGASTTSAGPARALAVELLRARLHYDPRHPAPPPSDVVIAPESEGREVCGLSLRLVHFRVGTDPVDACVETRYSQWSLRPTIDPTTDRRPDAMVALRAPISYQMDVAELRPALAPTVASGALTLDLTPQMVSRQNQVLAMVADLTVNGIKDTFQGIWNNDRLIFYAIPGIDGPSTSRHWRPEGFVLWPGRDGQFHALFIDGTGRAMWVLRHGTLTVVPPVRSS